MLVLTKTVSRSNGVLPFYAHIAYAHLVNSFVLHAFFVGSKNYPFFFFLLFPSWCSSRVFGLLLLFEFSSNYGKLWASLQRKLFPWSCACYKVNLTNPKDNKALRNSYLKPSHSFTLMCVVFIFQSLTCQIWPSCTETSG